MKSRIMLSEDIKQRIREEAIKQVNQERAYYTLCAIKLCLYVLHCELGFGEKRLLKIWGLMNQYTDELNTEYEDCWVAKIDSDLKRAGIEIKEE